MSTRNERFADSVFSLDLVLANIRKEKAHLLSDRGVGVERLLAAVDWDALSCDIEEIDLLRERYSKYLEAVEKIVRSGNKGLLSILEQIVKNGGRRHDAIVALSMKWRVPRSYARVKYWRGVKKLMKLFHPIESGVKQASRRANDTKACTEI